MLFVLALVTSQWRKLLRLPYDWWRLSHILFASFGFVAAIAHILGVGYYTGTEAKRALWLSVTLSWFMLVLWVRLAKPSLQLSRPYRVVSVRPERARTWILSIEPDGHAGLNRFRPGQFAWLTLRKSPLSVSEHPFSMASAPESLPRLEFGIKELGDLTRTVGSLEPGERVYLDAPYGVFTIDRHPDAPGFVGIVGGIGITPVMSMLRSMAARGDRRPVWLFYGNKQWDEVIYREQLDDLRAVLDLRLIHVLQEPPSEWVGERGFVSKDVLERHLPAGNRSSLRYFVCGPVPMAQAVEKALQELGIPPEHILREIYELA